MNQTVLEGPRGPSFTLAVSADPYAGVGHDRALGFADALVTRGMSIERVFFYEAGVNAAQCETASVVERWRKLAIDAGIPLLLCSASVDRYALQPQAPFVIAGLGSLLEASLDSTRLVQFS